MVDFTCTRTKCPSCSTAKSSRAVSPHGLVTHNPCSAARVIKRSSAHSPRSLGCLIFIPLFFMKFLSPTFFGGHSRPPDFFLTPTKTRPSRPRPFLPFHLTMTYNSTDANMPQVQNSPFSHLGNFAPCGAGALARALTPAMQPQASSFVAGGRAQPQPYRNLRPFLFCHSALL